VLSWLIKRILSTSVTAVSFCRPSRAPTSTILTFAGSIFVLLMFADIIGCRN
ncbi:hypothetical protein D049_0747B, partial [Vibrio parahaemolyticus VPTS-2010]